MPIEPHMLRKQRTVTLLANTFTTYKEVSCSSSRSPLVHQQSTLVQLYWDLAFTRTASIISKWSSAMLWYMTLYTCLILSSEFLKERVQRWLDSFCKSAQAQPCPEAGADFRFIAQIRFSSSPPRSATHFLGKKTYDLNSTIVLDIWTLTTSRWLIHLFWVDS